MYSQKIDTLESFTELFFTRKVSAVTFTEEGKALSQSQNDKISIIHLVTCFHHHNIFAKTLSRMTMAITFSCQNDAASHMHTFKY